jgi:hypothetical protein
VLPYWTSIRPAAPRKYKATQGLESPTAIRSGWVGRWEPLTEQPTAPYTSPVGKPGTTAAPVTRPSGE